MATSEARFMPGLKLSAILYEEAVGPLLREAFPGLRYAAARIGSGSEVLGFDTPRSADHEWGPRLELFLTAEDRARHGDDIRRLLSERLPKQLRGWPTHFQESDDPLDPVGRMRPTDGPVNHRVDVHDVEGGWQSGSGCARATRNRACAPGWRCPSNGSPRPPAARCSTTGPAP